MDDLEREQREICKRYGASFVPTPGQSIAGVARNFGSGLVPLNGLRHPQQGDTCGWFLWAGEMFPKDDDAFEPHHVAHLTERCSEAMPFLGLAPGWRFLLAGDYVDVWEDPLLLEV